MELGGGGGLDGCALDSRVCVLMLVTDKGDGEGDTAVYLVRNALKAFVFFGGGKGGWV